MFFAVCPLSVLVIPQKIPRKVVAAGGLWDTPSQGLLLHILASSASQRYTAPPVPVRLLLFPGLFHSSGC